MRIIQHKFNFNFFGAMEKQEKYESPHTTWTQVYLESGICSTSITGNDNTGSTVTATEQEYQEYDFSNDNNWDY